VTPPLLHLHDVYFVQFSLDGQRVASASLDRTARVWDARTGRALGKPLERMKMSGSSELVAGLDGKPCAHQGPLVSSGPTEALRIPFAPLSLKSRIG